MLRFIVVISLVVFFLIISIPLIGVGIIIRLFSKTAASRYSQVLVSFAFHVFLFFAGTKIIYKGLENVPKEPVLYVSNHRSYFDILTTYPKANYPTGYIAKKEISKVPSMSWWMWLLGCEFMDRKNIKKGMATLLASAEKIKNGYSMTIYPEGTRNLTKEPLIEFKGGALKIAEKAKCKIVPVIVSGTDDIWEKQFPKIKKANVIIEYLPPIDMESMDKSQRKELTENVAKLIGETYVKNEKERMELVAR